MVYEEYLRSAPALREAEAKVAIERMRGGAITPDRPLEAGDETGPFAGETWQSALFGTPTITDPRTGEEVAVAQAGIGPLAFLGLLGGAAGGYLAGQTLPEAIGTGIGLSTAAPVVAAPEGLPLVGPGVAEPPTMMVKKTWVQHVFGRVNGSAKEMKLHFYALVDGRIAMYHAYKKYWTVWRPKKNIVLSSNPRLKDLRKLDRVYNRMQKMVRKFAPRPKTRGVQVSSRFLSAAEKA
ncbi:unnamed protein product, partial [marine sediment metagenome]